MSYTSDMALGLAYRILQSKKYAGCWKFFPEYDLCDELDKLFRVAQTVKVLHSKIIQSKANAKTRGLEFDERINVELLIHMWIRQKGMCAILNKQMKLVTNDPHIVSIDRINSNKSYTPNNIQLSTSLGNYMKRDLNTKMFKDAIKDIVRS